MPDEQDYLAQTAAESRILQRARMLPENLELTDAVIAQIIGDARQYLAEFDMAQAEVARALGISGTYFSGVLSGSGSVPRTTRDKILRALNSWMEEDFRARMVHKPAGFVLLATAEMIISAARNVKAARTIGIVTGPAGCGKTITARFLAADDELPGTMLVTVDYDCRRARGLLAKIHAASRLRRRGKVTATLADVVERLKGSGRLLIIDQAHDLSSGSSGGSGSGFRLIQDLHDAAELPILLLGTVDIHKRTQDDQDVQFGQFSSRVGIRVSLMERMFRTGTGGRRLQWVTVEQLRKLIGGDKLKIHADVVKALAPLANWGCGHLRRCRQLVTLAEAIARGAKSDTVLLAHLEKAVALVEGVHRPLTPLPPEAERVEAVG